MTHTDGCAGNCGTNDFDNPPCPGMDGMTDQTYGDAIRRQAAAIGAVYDEPEAILALSDQLTFVRANPISEEEDQIGESTMHSVFMWSNEDTAAIALGRLRRRGWRLVHD